MSPFGAVASGDSTDRKKAAGTLRDAVTHFLIGCFLLG
jgi:hypothetical protein